MKKNKLLCFAQAACSHCATLRPEVGLKLRGADIWVAGSRPRQPRAAPRTIETRGLATTAQGGAQQRQCGAASSGQREECAGVNILAPSSTRAAHEAWQSASTRECTARAVGSRRGFGQQAPLPHWCQTCCHAHGNKALHASSMHAVCKLHASPASAAPPCKCQHCNAHL